MLYLVSNLYHAFLVYKLLYIVVAFRVCYMPSTDCRSHHSTYSSGQ